MILVDPGACWAACAALALMSFKPSSQSAPCTQSRVAAPRDGIASLSGAAPVRLAGLRQHEAMTVRPALTADGAALRALCTALAPADFDLLGGGAPAVEELARGAGCGDVHGVSLVAEQGDGPGNRLVGLVRLCADRQGIAGEFAILVHPAARCRGLGRLLLERLLAECRRRRLLLVRAAALPRNAAMLALARRCDFQRLPAADGTVELALLLAPERAPGGPDPAGRR